MHSFTSSSEPPSGRWGRPWLSALGVTVALLFGWEIYWREEGFAPSIHDAEEAWVVARGRVEADSIVLVGSSRIQSAIRPETFAERFDGRVPIHLGLPAGSPLPVLRHLAADADFAGLVIVDLIPRLLFCQSGLGAARARPFLRAYREAQQSPAKWLEAHLSARLVALLAQRSATQKDRSIVDDLIAGRWPRPPIYLTRPDRFRLMEFPNRRHPARAASWAQSFRTQFAPAVTEQAKKRILLRLEATVEQIQSRGGQVVLLRLPVSGDCRAAEEEIYPRELFWDPMAAETRALAIHFADYPALLAFECGDGSHFDHRDTPAFTAALVEVLKAELTRAGR